jgi:hypothetical protein
MSGTTATKVLHHEIRNWFLLAAPTVRSPVRDLLLSAEFGAADLACPLHVHRSVAEHLQSRGDRTYEFWRHGVNAALAEVDKMALQLYIAARVLGQMTTATSSLGVPTNSPGWPWWKYASLEEFHRSASLVETFVKKAESGSRDDGNESPESFARAIVMYTLLVDESEFELLLMLVNARLDALGDALAHGADEHAHAMCGEPLQTAKQCLAVLQRCAGLLARALSEHVDKAVSTLAKRVGMLNTACVELSFARGSGRSPEAPVKATFGRIRPRPNG